MCVSPVHHLLYFCRALANPKGITINRLITLSIYRAYVIGLCIPYIYATVILTIGLPIYALSCDRFGGHRSRWLRATIFTAHTLFTCINRCWKFQQSSRYIVEHFSRISQKPYRGLYGDTDSMSLLCDESALHVTTTYDHYDFCTSGFFARYVGRKNCDDSQAILWTVSAQAYMHAHWHLCWHTMPFPNDGVSEFGHMACQNYRFWKICITAHV